MTEDPIKDGLNWYAYCGGNPVNAWDPSGMIIQLNGTDEEKQTILNHLNMLSRDVLRMDENGMVYIGIQDKNVSNKPVGTDLIYQMIIDDNVCNIQIGKNNGTKPTNNDYDAASNGGTNATIFFNPDEVADIKVYDSKKGKIVKEPTTPFIALGHECIHALREMHGNRKKDGTMGTNKMSGGKKDRGRQEEFDTTGINHVRDDGTYANANEWWFTENSLRRENHLRERYRY